MSISPKLHETMRFPLPDFGQVYRAANPNRSVKEPTANFQKTKNSLYVSTLIALTLLVLVLGYKWFLVVRMLSYHLDIPVQILHLESPITGHHALSTGILNTIFATKRPSIRIGKMHINLTIFLRGFINTMPYARSTIFNQWTNITLTRLAFVLVLAETNG